MFLIYVRLLFLKLAKLTGTDRTDQQFRNILDTTSL